MATKNVYKGFIASTLEEIVGQFIKNKALISSFYQINKNLSYKELCKRAITGSTYRAFHRMNIEQPGMSSYFMKVAELFIKKDPYNDIIRMQFIEELKKLSRNKFKNWEGTNSDIPKIMKVYNLYANFWVAHNLLGSLESKLPSIKKLEVPLDKYSLYFISNLYNDYLLKTDNHNPEFRLINNLSMGSVIDMEHYNHINNFIQTLSNNIAEITGTTFCPIYLDVIQTSANNLPWYHINVNRKD
jgi:hypothetical protein